MSAKRDVLIDMSKFVAALLVVTIHSHPFKQICPTLDFLLCDWLARLAVPFFAVCTGYYITIHALSLKGSFGSVIYRGDKKYKAIFILADSLSADCRE